MAEWKTVAKASDIPVNESRAVSVGSRAVAVFNLNGTFYAIADECSHAGGPLSEGHIEGTTVACPWHDAIFDICTGEAKKEPACEGVAPYKVRVVGDDLQVEV